MVNVLICVLVIAAAVMLFWLVFGINWRSMRNYERRHQRFRSRLQAEGAERLDKLLFGGEKEGEIEEYFRPLAAYLAQNHRLGVSTAEEVEVITSGKRKYELLMRDLSNAKESIHMEYYHFGIDKESRAIRRLLMQKAREGVKVRFINENIGNFPIPNIYFSSMRRAGVEVVNFSNTGLSLLKFLATLSYRDHRKIVVTDGRIGYTGGMNITANYFRYWRDTHLRMTGEAVAGLQAAFLDTWLAAGGRLESDLAAFFPATSGSSVITQVVPDDPLSPEPLLQTAYEWVLHHAQKYVWFQSPYIAPPPSLLNAMRSAAGRGVDVRVMIPEECDTKIMRPINKAYYGELVSAGIQVLLSSGRFNHSKTFVCDDYLVCIGSTNLDYRSFGIDFEINTFFYDRLMAMQQKARFEECLTDCHLLTAEEAHATRFQRLMRHLAPIV
ncbi:MAG: cardiolipin synthase [Paludibacteraceae bacterium]|nr:cardiolipin synthase [Paludibacteraceae bacterium]